MAGVAMLTVETAAIATSIVVIAAGVMAFAAAGGTTETMSAATDAFTAGDPVSASTFMTAIITATANGSTAGLSSPAVAIGGIATAVASTGKLTVCPRDRAHHFP
jgi:hypothetical protein